METDPNAMRAQLVEGLLLLALPAQEQFGTLPAFVCAADELASLVLDPLEVLGHRWGQEGGKIDDILLEIKGIIDAQPEAFFSDLSVRESPLWEHLRTLARIALRELGVVRTIPSLDFVRFHPG